MERRTRTLRAEGYYVANVMAGLDAGKTVGDPNFVDSIVSCSSSAT